MKKIYISVILILICIALNAEGVLAPKYKDVKVSMIYDKVCLKDLLMDMSLKTNVNLVAGENSDWRVSEREISVKFSDISLENAMMSISLVTKLKWTAKDENTYVLNYDPETDAYISGLSAIAENNRNNARKEAVDSFFNSENNPDLKEEDPFQYLMNETGVGQAVAGAIESIPGMREALSNGTPMTYKGSDISAEAVNNINLVNSIVKNKALERVENNKKMKREDKKKFKGMIDRMMPGMPQDLSGVTFEVNSNLSGMPGAGMANNILIGNVVIKNNGRTIGGMPILNKKNPMVKKMGEALLEIYENPDSDPREIFESMFDRDSLMAEAGKSLNGEVYDNLKFSVPDDLYFDQEIELAEKPKNKWHALTLLADAMKTSVVCDSFGSLFDLNPVNSIPTKGTVKEITEKINENYGLTCEMSDKTFCFYSVKWFEEIQKLMPQAYIDRWNEEYINENYLSFDTLRQMGCFTQKQLSYAFGKAPALSGLSMNVARNYPLLSFVSGLDDDAAKEIMGKDGLSFSHLTDTGKEKLSKIREMINVSEKKGYLKLSLSKDEDKEVLKLVFLPTDKNEKGASSEISFKKYKPLDLSFGLDKMNTEKK